MSFVEFFERALYQPRAAKRMAAMRAEIMEMRRARAIMLKRERENYDKLCERVNELRAIRQLWITRLASR
jgi:hypothetical protein